MRRTLPRLFLLICVFFLVMKPVHTCAQEPGNGQSTAISTEQNFQSGDDYVIGVDDVLSVYVWKEPDFSVNEITVRVDGKISIPLINDVQASGLTTKELRESVSEKLADYITSPNVTVTVLKPLSRSVSIVGEVSNPGTYPLGAPITVLELLARAGGVNEYAKKKDIKVIREKYGRIQQFPFNYKDNIKGKRLEQNIHLEPGDVVLVP